MDGENRGEHDRTVMRALQSLAATTSPTAAERQRIRDRILLALEDAAEEDLPSAQASPPAAGTRREVPAPRDAELTDADPDQPPTAATGAADDRSAARPAGRRPVTDPAGGRSTARRGGGVRAQARPRSPEPGSGSRRRGAGRRGVLAGVRGRFAVAAVAVLALVGSLAGMSVLMARDALPGDALYGIKRTAEAAELGLTFGDEPKALKHLEFAAARISEIETLARRYPNPGDAPVGGYLTALTDFDNDATAGSRQLITLATSTDGRLLESLRDWSTQQATRLQAVTDRLPEAARNRQTATRGLLERITARADALLVRMDCYQITSGSFDDIGALPATGQCENNLAPTSGNTAPPSVPATPDSSGPATGPATPGDPLPPAEPTPAVPPVPFPGATATVPPTTRPSTPGTSTPGAPPILELPPLLPGLPPLTIG